MTRQTVLGVVVVLCLVASAQAQSVSSVEISNPGLYRSEQVAVEQAPDSVRGIFTTVRNPQLVERTTRVPGLLGTSFGVNFEIRGEPNGEPATVRFVTRFPAGGLRDPKTGKVHLTSENERQYRIGELAFRFYSFDEEWEIAPGEWSLEFWYRGQMLGAQKFEVYKVSRQDAPLGSDMVPDAAGR